MIRGAAARLLLLLGVAAYSWSAEQMVVDFEKAVPVLPDGNGNRVPRWEEKGVVLTLAHEPEHTKGKGMLMFFRHLSSGHIGVACAMATEPIPVRATFPKPVSSVTENKVVDRASLESVPGRKAPGDPVPIFTMTVKASRIAYIQFSGPREGEYLAADEVRFTPADDGK
jgi:hypothetical protein